MRWLDGIIDLMDVFSLIMNTKVIDVGWKGLKSSLQPTCLK